MKPGGVTKRIVLLPIHGVRTVMLTLYAGLACVEVGAGVVVAESWKAHRDSSAFDSLSATRLDTLLGRLRALELGFASAAVLMTMVWTFIAVQNVRRATRSSRSAIFAVLTWVMAPVGVAAIGVYGDSKSIIHLAIALLLLEALVMYLPFGTLAGASQLVGGQRAPFRRWYLAMVLAFVVNQVFTGSVNLASPRPDGDLGRTAVLYFVNGLIVGVMGLMAADATRSLHIATADKTYRHNSLQAESRARFVFRVPRQTVMAERDAVHAAYGDLEDRDQLEIDSAATLDN